jgi:hypothetical protein
MKKILLPLLLFVAFVACSRTDYFPDYPPEGKGNNMSIQEWKTYAMGRMLVDLPVGAVIDKKVEMFGGGIPIIWRKDLTPKSALIEVARREKEHKDFPPPPDRPPSKYIATIDLANGGKGILNWEDESLLDIRSYSQYIANLDCYFIANGQPRVFFYPYGFSSDNQESASQRMIALAPSLYSREENEFPSKPGFCFEGGFVADPYDWYSETSTLYISMPVYPGLEMVIDFQTVREVEAGTDAYIDLAKSQRRTAKIIRNRKVKFVEGFENVREICLRDTARYNEQREYQCVLAAEGAPNRPDRPNIYITMVTGDFLNRYDPDNPEAFQYDSECLELWDALVERIRPRPVTG